MTRSSSSAIVLAVVLLAASVPTLRSANRDTPQIDGRWTLNRTLSEIPRDVGFNLEGLPAPGGGTAPATRGGGGRGRRGSSGGVTGGGVTGDPFRARPQSADDASRMRQLTAEVRNPPAHLTIVEAQGGVTITDDRGHSRTYRTDGREAVLQLDDVPVRVTSTLEAGTFVVVYHVEPNHDIRYSYSATASPAQLIVGIQFVERGGGDSVRLVYEPTSDTERPAPAEPSSPSKPASSTAPASAGQAAAPQPFNQRPDAELTGLKALGIVVEDLSAQATACGLNKDTIETALAERLSKAGLKVQRNADEDTYLYVHIITTGPSNGLCVSRYDAFLYTHTTATLSYQTKPVLVQVELMHKGSMTGSALASHPSAVLRALQEYVDQFTTRIGNANK